MNLRLIGRDLDQGRYFCAVLPSYGNNRDINVVKLNISREIILQINPERANISELFERVLKGKFKTSAGLYDEEPFGLTEIK